MSHTNEHHEKLGSGRNRQLRQINSGIGQSEGEYLLFGFGGEEKGRGPV